MPDASPTKWHLGHTTWFFETFVTQTEVFDEQFAYLFNSYYESVGRRQPRAKRGLLSRPAHQRVLQYQAHIDEAETAAMRSDPSQHLLSLHPYSPTYVDQPLVALTGTDRPTDCV